MQCLSPYFVRLVVLAAFIEVTLSTASTQTVAQDKAADAARRVEYAIAIHGGALDDVEGIPADLRDRMEEALRKALTVGRDILSKRGTSLEAVEEVVRVLEDAPEFNAGRGAAYNSVGGHELDASIMDGRELACGAVAGVKTVRNPITLARLVMTKTRHVILIGDGAEQFAAEQKVELVDPKYFDTERQFKRWQKVKAEQEKQQQATPEGKKGTVGCVALDQHGNLAAATSTGGLTNKKYGRVGDSPIIGAGNYADNASCAVSCTGTGEEYIRNCVAHDVSARVKYQKLSLPESVAHVIHKVLQPEDGGLIAVGRDGTIVMDFNTVGMSRGAADSSGRFEVKLAK